MHQYIVTDPEDTPDVMSLLRETAAMCTHFCNPDICLEQSKIRLLGHEGSTQIYHLRSTVRSRDRGRVKEDNGCP